MKTHLLKLIFTALFLSGTLFAQQVLSVKMDDGTIVSEALDYSFVGDVDNTKLLSPLSCASGSNLVTFYATNNAQRGHMFDINATNCVTINCFEMNFSAGTSNVEIYTKAGTHVGFTNTPASWTLIGTALNVASAGVNVPTAIPINVNTIIGTGATQAFYITRTTLSGPTVAYTNGTGVGNVLASDANITLREGTGKEYPFSTNFTPRQFNGRVFYTVNPPCVLPIELTEFTVKHLGTAVQLDWTTVTEKNNKYFSIERSKDANNFEAIRQIDGAINSNASIHYSFTDEHPLNGLSYYRIKQTDTDGNWKYSEIKAVSYQRNINDLEIVPMPAQSNLNVSFKAIEAGDFKLNIYSAEGVLVYTSDIRVENGANDNQIDVSAFNTGIYQLILTGAKEVQRTKFVKE